MEILALAKKTSLLQKIVKMKRSRNLDKLITIGRVTSTVQKIANMFEWMAMC